MGDRPLSERVETALWGKLLISVAVVGLVMVEVVTNLPNGSAVVRSLGPSSNAVASALTIESSWGVFAPNPREVSIAFEGRVTFADGSEATWTIPSGWPVFENLRLYRWRKWRERVRDDSWSKLWEPTARWIASQFRGEHSPVVQVQLVRQAHLNTVTDPQPPWQEAVYYTLQLHPRTKR